MNEPTPQVGSAAAAIGSQSGRTGPIAANHPADLLDCLIIGAGPAGLTAALYLRRFHRRVLVADAGHSRARYIERSHNFPGFPEGIPGSELLARLRRQVEDVDGSFLDAEITAIVRRDTDGGGFVASATGRSIQARTVLIATGVVDKAPVLPGLEQVMRRGLVRQCPICDGHEHTGQRIAVLGDGPHAQREAVFISHFSRPVSLVGLTAGTPASPPEPDDSYAAAVADGRVSPQPSPAAGARMQEDGSIALTLGDGTVLPCDVLYAALGCHPRSSLALPLGVEKDEAGHLVVDPHCSTRVPGLYAAGDVVAALDQLTVAVGHGALAASAIHRYCLRAAASTQPPSRPAPVKSPASVESASAQ